MRRLRAFARFVYDFVIGDDPLVAIVVVLGLAVTALLADGGLAAWWVLPCFTTAALWLSTRRAST